MRKLTRKERRAMIRGIAVTPNENKMNLIDIDPITENQKKTFDAFDDGKNLFLHGCAGSGKTFIALYLALQEVMTGGKQRQIHLMRSAVPTRDIGFLKGDEDEKTKVYEEPYLALT